MELYTLQMAKWRVAKAQGILTLDTTMKTGEECLLHIVRWCTTSRLAG